MSRDIRNSRNKSEPINWSREVGTEEQPEAGEVGGGQVTEDLKSHEGEVTGRSEVSRYVRITDCRASCPGGKVQQRRRAT